MDSCEFQFGNIHIPLKNLFDAYSQRAYSHENQKSVGAPK